MGVEVFMNQSQKIRELVLDIFESEDKDFMKQEFEWDNIKRKGIKYIDLKRYLIDYKVDNEKFSEGAITGALQTLTERLENIHKVKTRNGVFFFYSEKKDVDVESDNSKTTITESTDFRSLENKVEVVNSAITDILKNASQGKYLEVQDSDLRYLREFLKVFGESLSVLSRYKMEKTFEKIENQKKDELPF